MFSFSTIITHPKVFIFRNWESFGNICIRSQSFLFAEAGEVVWVATFELKLNRDFKAETKSTHAAHHKSRWSSPSEVFFCNLVFRNIFRHIWRKKYQGSREAFPSHFQRWRSLRPSPCVWVGTLRDLERIDYFFSFQYHVMWISPIILMWNLWRHVGDVKKNLITLTNFVSRLYLFSKLSRAPIWWNDAEIHKF